MMAKKIKFALEMADGFMVRRSLEELREHFDLEKAVSYFLSGKLLEWLEDRYYDEEAEKIRSLDKETPNLNKMLCDALGVEIEMGTEMDIEQLERLNEKKAILREQTSDESIIANAVRTALTQEDLADLLDMDEPVIYLCGEKFNIPLRVRGKKYIGILGSPAISIQASGQEDLDRKDIVFENVRLPWDKTNTSPNTTSENEAEEYYQKAEKAKKDREFNDAIKWYTKSANLGNVKSMSTLGYIYLDGIKDGGISRDDEKSIYWYKEASKHGDGDAMCWVGMYYKRGWGVPIDMREAAIWFSKASEAGNSTGKYNLAAAYYKGEGVPQNRPLALNLYEESAMSGDTHGMMSAAYMYKHGDGVPADYRRAKHWFQKAAEAGEKEAVDVLNSANSYDTDLIGIIRSSGYNNDYLQWLVNAYKQNDARARNMAVSLGRQCRNYLPMGGSSMDNANAIIWQISEYLWCIS